MKNQTEIEKEVYRIAEMYLNVDSKPARKCYEQYIMEVIKQQPKQDRFQLTTLWDKLVEEE